MNNTLCYKKLKSIVILLTTTNEDDFVMAYKVATNSLNKNAGRMTWGLVNKKKKWEKEK